MTNEGEEELASAHTKRHACGAVYFVIGAGARGRGESQSKHTRTHATAMVDLHGKSLECREGVCGARLWAGGELQATQTRMYTVESLSSLWRAE